MFTKLKKKIAEEEISSESTRSQPPSPALSRVSTRKTSFTNGDVGRPLRAENKWEKRRLSNASLYGSRESLASERASTISRHSSFARVSSSPALSPMAGEPGNGRRRSKPDDLVAMLNQKNEQVKQLEAKLADFEEKFDDLTQSYEVKCSQLENEHQKRMQEKNEQLESIDKAYADQKKELASLQDRLDDLSNERTRFEMREQQLKGQITSLNQEKDALRDQLNNTVTELTQKTLQLSREEKSSKETEEELSTVRQSFSFYKSKTTSELEESQMLVSQLKEKVGDLEKRLENSKLSGNDQIKAIEKERELADQRLKECRQQLSELKAQSSDKFNTLGNLVSTLNERLDKKDAELNAVKKSAEEEKDDLEQKVKSLEDRLKRSDELVMSNQSTEADRVQTLQQRVLQLESEAESTRQQLTSTKRSYDNTIQTLEEQIKKLEGVRANERKDQLQKYDEFEQCRKEFMEMEEHYKEHISELEEEKFSLQEELRSKEDECRHVSSCLEDAMKRTNELKSQISRFESMLKEKELAEARSSSSMYLGGDAELIDSLRQELQEIKVKCDHHEDELLDRNETILNMRQKLQDAERQLTQTKEQVQEYEQNNKFFTDSPNGSIAGQTTKELYRQMASMRLQIRDLERQLEEKQLTNGYNPSEVQQKMEAELEDRNKRIKLLQQKVIELKRAIQKDLKMSPPDNNTNPTHTPRTRKDSETSTQSEKDYDYLEVNFKYLKHCVLRYMCGTNQHSRQLITVIGHLLRFTKREEMLVKDAAEWKLPLD